MKKSMGGSEHSSRLRYDVKRSHGYDYLSHIEQNALFSVLLHE